jgi:hypothetical protein
VRVAMMAAVATIFRSDIFTREELVVQIAYPNPSSNLFNARRREQ